MRTIRETVFELDNGQRITTRRREGLSLDAERRKDRAHNRPVLFQHRHFAKIARIIRELPDDQCDDKGLFSRAEIANHFARELDTSNVRFDRERFLRAARED